MAEQKVQITEITVHIEFIDGKKMSGRVQMPVDMGVTKFFNQPVSFFVLKTDLGRSLIINKAHIYFIEPQDARTRDA